ncbi:MAG: DNA-binding protein [Bacteroidales bacterium]|nr:DNA-binding protein [Bacteroidales bacterium]
MKTVLIRAIILVIALQACHYQPSPDLTAIFNHPPESTRPWVFWYWIQAAVSKEGITADLEAMKEAGIGGAYLFTIRGADNPPLIDPPFEQLTPEWWDMVEFAFSEAGRLGLKLAMHACDGFTTAGGPWITPEMSMQKVVWAELSINGNQRYHNTLPQPETREGYYQDIALFAYPTPAGAEFNTSHIIPEVTASVKDVDPQYLCDPENKKVFRCNDSCWIQYAFKAPFTCRNIYIRTNGLNYPSHRLIIESSDDGIRFNRICRLEPPRHGWQDYEADITHSISPTTARYFRLVYDKKGSEPGSEDLDAARWNPALKIMGITLSGKAVIHQYEGKNGSIWRVSKRTDADQIPDSLFMPLDKIINLTHKLKPNGTLVWDVPPGKWTLLRIGNTSTGKTNYIGGRGKGLECDKFNPEIVRYQFDQWFGRACKETDPVLAREVLKVFHVDSWECGSQNWSSVFPEEFRKRRGYDILPYLPLMTGLPVENAQVSEGFLYDIRQTIAELIADNFFGTMAKLAQAKGCLFSAESVAPVMVSDAMLHYKQVDIPMGEFWYNSPTHDKPTDILDAISAAHLYGKPVIQAEAFTTLRMTWSESPADLKTTADRNFALGINRLVFHVFTHNPWTDRKPGMTLNGVGLYFQRDQTWWEQGKAWIEYITRCQALLQQGTPVVDIAVYTGDELPQRALTPDRLIEILPGLFDPEKIRAEKIRLENAGVPMHEKPDGVKNSANSYDPVGWTDPLRGYRYDAINKFALIRLARVRDGKIILPGGMSYKILVIPGRHKMNPNNLMSAVVAEKILQLVKGGATVVFGDRPEMIIDLSGRTQYYDRFDAMLDEMLEGEFKKTDTGEGPCMVKKIGKGRIIKAPYQAGSFSIMGTDRDLIVVEKDNSLAGGFAWNHRYSENCNIYFISNQYERLREIDVSFRIKEYVPEIFDPLNGSINPVSNWTTKDGRTMFPLRLEPNASLFIVFRKKTHQHGSRQKEKQVVFDTLTNMHNTWNVAFDLSSGDSSETIQMSGLTDWTNINIGSIRNFSGTATYKQTFELDAIPENDQQCWLDLGKVADLAEVWVNGNNCGIAWTYPFRVNISAAVRRGENTLMLKVTNTWRNRLIGDHELSTENKNTWTTAPYRLEGKLLAKSGLLGPVIILQERK